MRKSGEGNGTPLQNSCLENPMDGGAWQAAVHGVRKSRTRLSDFTFTFHFHALEKEMATHSSVLAWRIPRDRGAWWAAVYGVAQNRTRLKRLSSSIAANLQLFSKKSERIQIKLFRVVTPRQQDCRERRDMVRTVTFQFYNLLWIVSRFCFYMHIFFN